MPCLMSHSRGVDHVVGHLPAPFLVSGIDEFLPVARRAPVIDVQDGVAAIGQERGLGVVSPAIAQPRAAVNHEDGGQVMRGRTPMGSDR